MKLDHEIDLNIFYTNNTNHMDSPSYSVHLPLDLWWEIACSAELNGTSGGTTGGTTGGTPNLWYQLCLVVRGLAPEWMARAKRRFISTADRDGVRYQRVAGLLHSVDDLPSVYVLDLEKTFQRRGTNRQNEIIVQWHRWGRLHRVDGPSSVDSEGTCSWYLHGKLHRDLDQPAVIKADGSCSWYLHGKLHRDLDQPAVIWSEGRYEWWQHGKLHRSGDQPAVVCRDGACEWYSKDKLHRDGDLPAVVRGDGTCMWWQHGKLHRMGGPALVRRDGTCLQYTHDVFDGNWPVTRR